MECRYRQTGPIYAVHRKLIRNKTRGFLLDVTLIKNAFGSEFCRQIFHTKVDDEYDGDSGCGNGGETRPSLIAFLYECYGGGFLDHFLRFPCGREPSDRFTTLLLPLSTVIEIEFKK